MLLRRHYNVIITQVNFWCMLIYALTGRVRTIELIRAVPTILFCNTQPMWHRGRGKWSREEDMTLHKRHMKWSTKTNEGKSARDTKRKENETLEKLTVITAPVDIDTASVITGELSVRETGWVCWRHKHHHKQSLMTSEMNTSHIIN